MYVKAIMMGASVLICACVFGDGAREHGGKGGPAKPNIAFAADANVMVERKDYGPIPDRKYTWLVDGDATLPKPQTFQLANGAKIDLVQKAPLSFAMMNHNAACKGWHNVTITRPFWMSKTCVTVDQWREYAPTDCEDCRALEKELDGKALTYLYVTRKAIDEYCAYLTAKYSRQLPKGYVFRLPTEAEWACMLDYYGTLQKYDKPNVKAWRDFVGISGETVRNRFAEIRKNKPGDELGKFDASGWKRDLRYRIGGLTSPLPTGVLDAYGEPRWALDVCLNGTTLSYADEEVDPLRWSPDLYKSSKCWIVTREWERSRPRRRWDDLCLCHIVLGPDLIAEKAWENQRKEYSTEEAKLPKQRSKLDPSKIPAKCNPKRHHEIAIKRVGGKEMVFCSISKGKFNMSNVKGQAQRYHRVEITKPFWMSKFLVTADEWREFAPNDYQMDYVKTVENLFNRNPSCVCNMYHRWMAYCDFLNARYGSLLPPGYVFRLPTEAEWEWAFIADERGDIRRMVGEFSNDNPKTRAEFETMKKRAHAPRTLEPHIGTNGQIVEVYIGGRTRPSDFGVFDMVAHGGHDVMMLDSFDTQGAILDDGSIDRRRANAALNIVYDERKAETDPIRYAGKCRNFVECRTMGGGRYLPNWEHWAYAHIVIAPDLVSSLKKSDLAEFPMEDFGGKFLGDRVKYVAQSSMKDRNRNTPERFKRMVSRENLIVPTLDKGSVLRGFQTQDEDSPWIMVDLGKEVIITGLAIDSFHGNTEHLCIWTPSSAKTIDRLVHKETLLRKRYRIDFRFKNIRSRYLCIGREPKFRKAAFHLDKLVIYGKDK